MRHRIDKKFFNRDTNARKGLLSALTTNLFLHGEIVTTKPKAQVAARQAAKMITIAKKGDLSARRRLHRVYGRRDVVNNLVDRVAPLFKDRESGFTRVIEVGNRRGDNVKLFKLSLIEVLPPVKEKAKESKK
ncbi:MAG: 50S ribosomal protein L17 [Pseudomonadales bacterium]|jgi:large subunit ribosomal protein L17|nr:50S ribosomal protein L17 [Pseudomonadales bacterium]